ncbi:hypothetical protein Y032_0057g2723, partial [Ancylostoma ceylanicum]
MTFRHQSLTWLQIQKVLQQPMLPAPRGTNRCRQKQEKLQPETTAKKKRKTRQNLKQRRLTQSLRIPLANLPNSTEDLSQEDAVNDRNDDLYENLLAATQKARPEQDGKESLEQKVKVEYEFLNEAASSSSTDIHVDLHNSENVHDERRGNNSEKSLSREVVSYEERQLRSTLNRLGTSNETVYTGPKSTILQASYHECTLNAAFSRSTSPSREDMNAARSIKGYDIGHQSSNGEENQDMKHVVSVKQTSTCSTSFEERTSLLAIHRRNELEETSFMTEDAHKATHQYSEFQNSPFLLQNAEQEDNACKILEDKNTLCDSLNDQCKNHRLVKMEKHENISFVQTETDKVSLSFSDVNRSTQLLSSDESSSAAKEIATISCEETSLILPLEMRSAQLEERKDNDPISTNIFDSHDLHTEIDNQNSQVERRDQALSEDMSFSTRTRSTQENTFSGIRGANENTKRKNKKEETDGNIGSSSKEEQERKKDPDVASWASTRQSKVSSVKAEKTHYTRNEPATEDEQSAGMESSDQHYASEEGISASAKKIDAKTKQDPTENDTGAKPSAKKTEEVRDARSPSGKKDTRTASLESSDENVPKESGFSAFAKKLDAKTKQDATENDTGAKPSAKKTEEVRDACSPSGKKDTRTASLESSNENSAKEGGISAFAKKLDAKTKQDASKDDAGAKPSGKKTEEVRDARSPSGKKDERTANLERCDKNVPKESGISAFAKKVDAKAKKDAAKDDTGAKPSAKKTEELRDTRS